MLRNPATREGTLRPHGGIQRTVEVAKPYARHLGSAIFDDVRDEVKASRFWHGYDRVEDAFAAIGAASDYFMLYDGSNF